MSKLSPLGQSASALFSNEAAAKRSAKKESGSTNSGAPGSFKIAGFGGSISGQKSGDSTGNPNSPGYDGPPGKKKESAASSDPSKIKLGAKKEEDTNSETIIEVPVENRTQSIRLSVGWEKILIAQKKLCEKAKKLFTDIEAPELYQANRKGKNQLKSIGCIVDLDIEDHRKEQEAKLKAEKKKESA